MRAVLLMKGNLDTVVELQKALDVHQAAEELLAGVPDWMREIHDEYTAAQTEIAEIEQERLAAELERRGAESEAADEKEKLRRFQEQISQVRNQREYAALLQEIDVTKERVKALEERAMAAYERDEEHSQALEKRREEMGDLQERYAEAEKRWESEKPAVAAEAAEVATRIAELRKELPRRMVAQFERIRDRLGGQALSPVLAVSRPGKGAQMWSCGACNYRVRPQAVVEIRNAGSIVHCDSCKRILYVDEADS